MPPDIAVPSPDAPGPSPATARRWALRPDRRRLRWILGLMALNEIRGLAMSLPGWLALWKHHWG